MRITIELAGISMELITDNNDITDYIKKDWNAFISKKKPTGSIRITSEVTSRKFGAYEKEDVFFSDKIYKSNNWFNTGRFDFNRNKGEVHVKIKEDNPITTLRSFLRNLWALFLVQKGMLLMHAAAIKKGQYGYIFSGPSRSGKTTIVSRSNKQSLGDDVVVLKKDANDRPIIISTMLGGEYPAGKEEEVPLKGVYFIEQGTELRAEKLSETDAFYNMLHNSIPFMLFEKRSPEIFRKLFRLVPSYSSIADCYMLVSRKEDDVWKVIR
jgi:hypothetical protein